jgi:tRNA-guanine family transglycosylase
MSGWTKGYIWDYLPGLLDGILISRMAVAPARVSRLRRELQYAGTIIGDSGAHTYRREDAPPFDCADLMAFYEQGEFNCGMALDMVASPWVRPGGVSEAELERRLRVTIENAETCKDIHARSRYAFELMGVVQGWDADSYRRCASALLVLEYDYLAIAGQRDLKLVRAAVEAVTHEARAASRHVKIHVLGTGNPRILAFYANAGITSFDSATWLRKAWLDDHRNYFVARGADYHAYRATRVGLRPWDGVELEWTTEVDCDCPFCREMGQEILLFRGRQRNFRRGFHNVYQYMRLLEGITSKVISGESL